MDRGPAGKAARQSPGGGGRRTARGALRRAASAAAAPAALPSAIRGLLKEGWHVEAEGKLYRQPGEIHVEVTSGIDWFDLNVKADFGGVAAPLPRLLAALRKGDNIVQLDDGTFGMLP